jgi:hypothetical protein
LELYRRINYGITFINPMIGYMRSIGNESIYSIKYKKKKFIC